MIRLKATKHDGKELIRGKYYEITPFTQEDFKNWKPKRWEPEQKPL